MQLAAFSVLGCQQCQEAVCVEKRMAGSSAPGPALRLGHCKSIVGLKRLKGVA
jgi:hypothetical protein